MLRYVLFDLDLFSEDGDRDGSERALLWLLEILAWRNEQYLKRHPNTPRLYESGVVYKLPEQMETADVPQVEIVREALAGAGIANGEVLHALDEIAQMCGGREHFRDIPRVMENGGGDCFPLDARVLRRVSGESDASEPIAISRIRRGDFIWGRGSWTEVVATRDKGALSVDRIRLEDDSRGDNLRLTRDHKVFILPWRGRAPVGCQELVRRIAVGQLERGMMMIRPRMLPYDCNHPRAEAQQSGFRSFHYNWDGKTNIPIAAGEEWFPVQWGFEKSSEILSIERDVEHVPCCDITTRDHYVYSVDGDAVVSQCDNLSSWRVAELRRAGIKAAPYITSRPREGGGTIYHAIVRWPDGSSEDPSLLLGMGGRAREKERAEERRKNAERVEKARKAIGTARLLGILPRPKKRRA